MTQRNAAQKVYDNYIFTTFRLMSKLENFERSVRVYEYNDDNADEIAALRELIIQLFESVDAEQQEKTIKFIEEHRGDDTAIAESIRELIEEMKQAAYDSETAEKHIVACSDGIRNSSDMSDMNILQVYWAREATETALTTARKVENMFVELEHDRNAQA